MVLESLEKDRKGLKSIQKAWNGLKNLGKFLEVLYGTIRYCKVLVDPG